MYSLLLIPNCLACFKCFPAFCQLNFASIKNNAISKFEEAGFLVEKCVVDAELDTKKNNAGIHSINVRITGSVDEGQLAKTIKMLAEEYEIEESKIKVSIK